MNFQFYRWKRRLFIFLSVFGPATIAAMADNDAAGVATYSIAGATLGYAVLFILFPVTILLAITQEMGIRLTIVTKKGLADLIREKFGVKAALLVFTTLCIANLGTIVVDVSAIKTMSNIFGIPPIPATIGIITLAFLFISKGNYKINQNIFLITCLFYFAYIFSAFKASPNWGQAFTNLIFPVDIRFDSTYISQYVIIGLGVLGTTITPWGQFFISSFADDKQIDDTKLKYSQMETYWGAFLTDFFSFFMIVATAATLFSHNIPLLTGEDAALAIRPFAGEFASSLFAIGIMAAGFMGMVIVSLSTAYAYSEFFGYSGSLDLSFGKSKGFYMIFLGQLVIAGVIAIFPFVNLFQLAVLAQIINAMMLPFVFYYLVKLTRDKKIMSHHVNTPLQSAIMILSIGLILIASCATLIFSIISIFK
jgi:Mn2+/Fe2+ NRAMP family transporter